MKILTIGLFMINSAVSMEFIAHRGLSSEYRENSSIAIEKALGRGFEYIEVDLHRTSDKHIIAIHDYSIDRTTSSKGSVVKLKLSEIKKADAQVPTLIDVFEIVQDSKVKLILEVKNSNNLYPGIEEEIVASAKKYPKVSVIYKSFSRDVLDRFHVQDPEAELLFVTIGKLWKFPLYIDDWLRTGSIFDYKKAKYYQVHKSFLTKSFVKEAHALNKLVIAWDVQDFKSYTKMRDLGVDIIETDHPPASLTLNPNFSK